MGFECSEQVCEFVFSHQESRIGKYKLNLRIIVDGNTLPCIDHSKCVLYNSLLSRVGFSTSSKHQGRRNRFIAAINARMRAFLHATDATA